MTITAPPVDRTFKIISSVVINTYRVVEFLTVLDGLSVEPLEKKQTNKHSNIQAHETKRNRLKASLEQTLIFLF